MTKEVKTTEEKTFITDEEKQQVSDIRLKSQQTYFSLGQLEIEQRKHEVEAQNRFDEIEKAKDELVKNHEELVQREKTLIEQLRDKYGDGELNPTTGEFIPNK